MKKRDVGFGELVNYEGAIKASIIRHDSVSVTVFAYNNRAFNPNGLWYRKEAFKRWVRDNVPSINQHKVLAWADLCASEVAV